MVLYIVDHLISIHQFQKQEEVLTVVNLGFYLPFSLLLSNFLIWRTAFFFHLQFFLHLWHFFLCLHLHVILSHPVLQLFISNEVSPPLRDVAFLVTLLLKEGVQGSVCQDLLNQHMPIILCFYGHLLLLALPHICADLLQEFCRGHFCSSIPAWAWSLLVYSLGQTTAAFQSSLIQQSEVALNIFWTHSDHQG